jgi:excinuclease ABC subunit C
VNRGDLSSTLLNESPSIPVMKVFHELKDRLSEIPHDPGCYIYKSGSGKDAVTLYIGKAKDLKKRVSQYFLRDRDGKTVAMLNQARHIEWIVTRTEVEALVLEARLIRQHKPPFNIDLKDNKRYAYIKITDEEFPRLVTTRENDARRQKDIVGPFTDGTERMHLTAKTRKLFRLRVCNTMPKKVCLYYHLGQCSGPCEGKISKEEYRKDVDHARLFLHGQSPELVRDLEHDMGEASKALRFEEAKRLRDTISAVQHTSNRQILAREKRYDEDVVLVRKQQDLYFFLVLHVKKGMITGTEEFPIALDRVDEGAPLDDFLKSYYQENPIPDEVLLEEELKDDSIKEYLSAAKTFSKIQVLAPKTGPKRGLLDVGVKNIMARINQTHHVLLQVQEALRLPALPRRIDAFDNSHIQGTNVVSACIQFFDGKPNKSMYRKFILTVKGNDDFASMRESVLRRYKSLLAKKESVPDLILIDGGKGQLHAASDALQELQLTIPVISLAKREEEVYVPGLPNPLPLDKKSETSLFLQRVRNEVHRFAITFHRQRRTQHQKMSILDDVPGIGEKTKFALLKRFGSVEGIKKASDDSLRELLKKKQLDAIREALH